jgi:apolipoprotein N-acyltransferase
VNGVAIDHNIRAEWRSRFGGWLLSFPLLTLILQSVIFLGMNWSSTGSVDFWPLGFVCLTPWLLFVVTARRRHIAYLLSYALGVAFFLINTDYLRHITIAGYAAVGFYFGLFYLLVALALRPAYLRWRLPLTLLVPIVWVAAEYGRALGPLAFPFLYLSHGAYRQLVLIQVSDIGGAYAVSFFIAMINGFIADCAICALAARPVRISADNALGTGGTVSKAAAHCATRLFWPVLIVSLAGAATIGYGVIQLSRSTMSDGPKIAVLQGDYPLSVDPNSSGPDEEVKAARYLDLLEQAAAAEPDLILLPETPWAMCLNEEFLAQSTFPARALYYEELQRRSRNYRLVFQQSADATDASIVVGASAMEFPAAEYPNARKYNSAFIFTPHSTRVRRYDKAVLVMFGEYTPFRHTRLHAVYRWLDSFNPFSSPDDEFSLTAGKEFSVWDVRASSGREYHFGIPICFEDLFPRVSREFAGGAGAADRADFLLSISNDGWFNHGSMVPQHLAVCAFRAVENRVGIARSVNTACSGFVDPNGRIHHLVNDGGRILGRGLFGFEVARVRLDARWSFYTRWGDWFAILCTVAGAGVFVGGRVSRRVPATEATP